MILNRVCSADRELFQIRRYDWIEVSLPLIQAFHHQTCRLTTWCFFTHSYITPTTPVLLAPGCLRHRWRRRIRSSCIRTSSKPPSLPITILKTSLSHPPSCHVTSYNPPPSSFLPPRTNVCQDGDCSKKIPIPTHTLFSDRVRLQDDVYAAGICRNWCSIERNTRQHVYHMLSNQMGLTPTYYQVLFALEFLLLF